MSHAETDKLSLCSDAHEIMKALNAGQQAAGMPPVCFRNVKPERKNRNRHQYFKDAFLRPEFFAALLSKKAPRLFSEPDSGRPRSAQASKYDEDKEVADDAAVASPVTTAAQQVSALEAAGETVARQVSALDAAAEKLQVACKDSTTVLPSLLDRMAQAATLVARLEAATESAATECRLLETAQAAAVGRATTLDAEAALAFPPAALRALLAARLPLITAPAPMHPPAAVQPDAAGCAVAHPSVPIPAYQTTELVLPFRMLTGFGKQEVINWLSSTLAVPAEPLASYTRGQLMGHYFWLLGRMRRRPSRLQGH